MLSLSYFALLASASTAFAWSPLFERAPPGCLADNCLRAITGTQPGQTQSTTNRAGDCSSFLIKTVTPDTVTVTTTASIVSSTTLSSIVTTITTTTAALASAGGNEKRSAVTVSPTHVPAYASPCSGVVRYSSACSCAGVTGSTITVSAPTITKTVSVSSTTTVDVVSTSTSIVIAAPALPSACATEHLTFPLYAGQNWDDVGFNQIFAGSGFSETPNNPSLGPWNPAKTTTFPGTMTSCDAALACSEFAWQNNNAWFNNVDIHYLISENQWSCIAYQYDESSAADYSVANPDIGAAMGYQWDGECNWC